MKPLNITNLNNGIKLIIRNNPNTPRTAVNVFIDAGIKYEQKAGLATIVGRLLLQGTKNRNAEDLANELDLHAIEMDVDTQEDYLKIKTVALNEDFDKAISILEDVVKNSTFDDLNKEIKKFRGEIEVILESPKAKANDNLIKNIYPDHPYGHINTLILKDLPLITKDLVQEFFSTHFTPEKIVISVVGSIDEESIKKVFNDKLGNIVSSGKSVEISSPKAISETKLVTIAKEDAAQAQIYQGWIVPDIASGDYAALVLLNVILGSSGLSSRLFVELRDKKGLAYSVRSTYESMRHSGLFAVYIGTAPPNINTCLEGFNTEIKKLQDKLISDKELQDAKNNYIGKRAFFRETNSQQAHYLGFYEIMGLGAEHDSTIIEKVKKVTPEDIKRIANKYLSGNSITSILAPTEFLNSINR